MENQNLKTTYTKIFVGGLPWITRNEGLWNYFQQFGEIVHVNVVCDRQTTRSKGYGFVTFKTVESANRACQNPNPIIDGRRANCNLASNGRNVNQNQLNQINVPNHSAYFDPIWNEYYNQQYNRLWQYNMYERRSITTSGGSP